MKRKAGRNPDTGKRTYYSNSEGAPVFGNKTDPQSSGVQVQNPNRYVSWGERLKRALGRDLDNDRVTDIYTDRRDALEEAGQKLTEGGTEKKG